MGCGAAVFPKAVLARHDARNRSDVDRHRALRAAGEDAQ
jgi:hypothetical protein